MLAELRANEAERWTAARFRVSCFFIGYFSFSTVNFVALFDFVGIFRLSNGPNHTVWEERSNEPILKDDRKRGKQIQEMTELSDVMHNLRPCELSVHLFIKSD